MAEVSNGTGISMDLTQSPATDPAPVLRYRDGLYAVDLLTAAIVFYDFFSRLEEAPADLQGVCSTFGFAERPADVMLTLFAANGFVSRDHTGTFHCTGDPLVEFDNWQ